MNRTAILVSIIVIACLLALGIGIAAILLRESPEDPEPAPGVFFPHQGTSGSVVSPRETIFIPNQDGAAVAVENFIDNGITIKDPANPDVYYLAGSSGACDPDGTCPMAGSSEKYNIAYFESDNSFVIGITDEPLSQVRREAERALQEILGIPEEEMCGLNYTIGTTVYVNQAYGGTNLGFSFCPGATALP